MINIQIICEKENKIKTSNCLIKVFIFEIHRNCSEPTQKANYLEEITMKYSICLNRFYGVVNEFSFVLHFLLLPFLLGITFSTIFVSLDMNFIVVTANLNE